MPTLTTLSCHFGPTSSNVHRTDRFYSGTNLYSLLSGIRPKYVHVSFSVSLWSFSVSCRFFLVSFRSFSVSFRSFSVFFGPFRSFSVFIATARPCLGLPHLPYFQFSLNLPYFLPFRHPSGCHPVIYLFLPCSNISEPQFLTFVIQLYRPYLPKFHTWFSCQNLNFLGIYLTLREPNLFSIVVLS